MGLHPSEILIGYDKASKKTMEILDTLAKKKLENPGNKEALVNAIMPVVASKQFGQEAFLTDLIADACLHTLPKNSIKFNVDNVRIQKILGGGIYDSKCIQGVVVTKASETSIKKVFKAKVAVFNTNIEMQ